MKNQRSSLQKINNNSILIDFVKGMLDNALEDGRQLTDTQSEYYG